MGRRRDEEPSCWDRALRLLSRQDSSEARLRRKLVERGYDSEEVDQVLVRLTDYGYLDDGRYARRWAEEKLRRGPLGRRRLQADLRQRGIDSALAHEVAEDVLPDNDLDFTRQAASNWSRRKRGDDRALARYLERLGFTSSSIASVLAERREARNSAAY